MKVNELRYGNWIRCHTCQSKEPFQVDFYTFEDDYGTGCIERWYEGVPITEEWLVKFGLENKNEIIIDSFGRFYLLRCQDVQIKYVHQLQNLYFALTGIELTIK